MSLYIRTMRVIVYGYTQYRDCIQRGWLCTMGCGCIQEVHVWLGSVSVPQCNRYGFVQWGVAVFDQRLQIPSRCTRR
jgi:hypothetical protein